MTDTCVHSLSNVKHSQWFRQPCCAKVYKNPDKAMNSKYGALGTDGFVTASSSVELSQETSRRNDKVLDDLLETGPRWAVSCDMIGERY